MSDATNHLGSANSLRELGLLAADRGLHAALGQPLRRLWERADQVPELRGLGDALAGLGDRPLRELLEDAALLKDVKRAIPDAARKALPRGVRLMLEAPEVAESKRPATDAIPQDGALLRAWAERHGVAARLGRSVGSVAGALPAHLRAHASVWNHQRVIDVLDPDEILFGSSKHLRQLQQWLREWLADAADEVVAARAAAADLDAAGPHTGPAPELGGGVLAQLWQQLVVLRHDRRSRHAPMPPPAGKEVTLSYLQAPPAFYVNDRRPALHTAGYAEHPVGNVALEKLGPEVSVRCAHRSWNATSCVHELTAIDVLLAYLRSLSADQRATLEADLGRPPWAQTLLILREAAAKPPPRGGEGARLIWVLAAGGSGGWVLTPFVQKRTKRGGFTAGRRTDYREIAEDAAEAYSDADRTAALNLVDYGHRGLALTQALAALVGQDNVRLAGSDAPLRVATTELRLVCRELGGKGFTLEPAVDGRPLTPEIVGSVRRHFSSTLPFVHVEPERGICWLVRVPQSVAMALSVLDRRSSTFPPESADAIVETLADSGLPVQLPEALLGREVPPSTTPAVYVTPLEPGSFAVEVRIQPLPGAPPLPAGSGPLIARGRCDDERAFTRRDLAAETTRAAEVLRELDLEGTGAVVTVAGAEALEAFHRLERAYAESGLEVHWPPRRPRVTRPLRLRDLSVQVTDGHDWFGLAGAAQLDGKRVELAAILEAARSRQRYVRVADDTWAELEEHVTARLQPLADLTFATKKGHEVSVAAAGLLDELEPELAALDTAPAFGRLVERIATARHHDAAVPGALASVLRPYQVEGFRWLARLAAWGAGACLADDMGLGKTLEALALLLHRREVGPALVVAPTSVCSNWQREAATFARELRVVSYYDCDRDGALDALGPGDVLVASYGLVTRDAERFAARRFATLVVDEAQAVKNAASLRARAVRDLDAEFRVALTGTPLENHLGELWAVMRVAFPGLLGSQESFRDRFAVPIERHGDERRRRALALLLRPFILRRTKGEVARELPPRTDVVVPVMLSADERRRYEEARLAAIADLTGAAAARPEQRRIQVLAALTNLRQLATHPALVDGESDAGSSKLTRFLELVDELRDEGHRVLVFSQFVRHLDLARRLLVDRGVSFQYLAGDTPEAERRRRVEAFQAGEGDVFLISLKAGGTGLNLTGADNVIHLDPWWNPAVEDQASDRAHRIGQTRPVTVYRLISRGTVEEQIVTLHATKRALVAGVLEGTSAAARLDADDLMALLREGVGEAEVEEG